MRLSSAPMQLMESSDRRVLGAIRFVDAVSGLPVNGSMRIETRGATMMYPDNNVSLNLGQHSVKFLRNRSGLYVILSAPYFDDYTDEFLSPVISEYIQNGIMRFNLAVEAGDTYLPQEFDLDLPRRLSPEENTVFVSGDLDNLKLKNVPFAVPVTDGKITINGNEVNVVPEDTVAELFAAINTATNSDVVCSYCKTTDQFILNGKSIIELGSTSDKSNFLVISRLKSNGRQVVRSHGRVTGSVFVPVDIPLFRFPSARVENGMVILRTSVKKKDTHEPLPGVLVRVYRLPRKPEDLPIGMGLSDWRGLAKGEAFVVVTGITRFKPGSGESVLETEQPVEIETIRNPSFTGAEGQLPHVTSLLFSSETGQLISKGPVINVSAGKEYIVSLIIS